MAPTTTTENNVDERSSPYDARDNMAPTTTTENNVDERSSPCLNQSCQVLMTLQTYKKVSTKDVKTS
ncbi:hypothetical protein QE152_g26412 [Popillia japonica]|uniref:Uncharacterized protein n=1 Tax=Popillia japonica TaxID=7064 RepID=A0AAW1JXP7_POPJA